MTQLFIGSTEAISKAVYDMAQAQIAAATAVLDRHGVPQSYTLASRIDTALRYAEMRGATWNDDLELEADYQQTVDDLQGRM